MIFFAVCTLGGAVWSGAYLVRRTREDRIVAVTPPPRVSPNPGPESVIVAEIVFPRRDLKGTVSYPMELKDRRSDLSAWVAEIIQGLAHPPSPDAVPVFAEGVLSNRAFVGGETLYIDLPRSALSSSTAGIELEGLALRALLRSVVKNVKGIESLKILSEGREVETFWGHFDLRLPLRL